MKYRSLPVEIEAVQFDGSNMEDIAGFVGQNFMFHAIVTDDGLEDVSVGDYVVKGRYGNFFVLDAECFLRSYEEIK